MPCSMVAVLQAATLACFAGTMHLSMPDLAVSGCALMVCVAGSLLLQWW